MITIVIIYVWLHVCFISKKQKSAYPFYLQKLKTSHDNISSCLYCNGSEGKKLISTKKKSQIQFRFRTINSEIARLLSFLLFCFMFENFFFQILKHSFCTPKKPKTQWLEYLDKLLKIIRSNYSFVLSSSLFFNILFHFCILECFFISFFFDLN